MEPTASALGALQQKLAQLITAPSDSERADEREIAALLRGDANGAPGERLAIYANAYFARLHDCLEDDFGALARSLGPDAFHDLVKTYLMIHPPQQPSLRHAGAHLAEHLAAAPFAAIFARRCPYAADLARLEWAIALAFVAADAPVLAREALAAIAPDAWVSLRFAVSPSLALLRCRWPVQIARERFEHEGDGETWPEPLALAPEPTAIRVWRCDERVRFAPIGTLECEALERVRSGATFAELCDRLAAEVGDAEATAQAAAFLASWIADGLLAGVEAGD